MRCDVAATRESGVPPANVSRFGDSGEMRVSVHGVGRESGASQLGVSRGPLRLRNGQATGEHEAVGGTIKRDLDSVNEFRLVPGRSGFTVTSRLNQVKLAHQESELVVLLKRIPLGPAELAMIRQRAEQLRDGVMRSRGHALLPIMLASFIYDALDVPSMRRFGPYSDCALSVKRGYPIARYICLK